MNLLNWHINLNKLDFKAYTIVMDKKLCQNKKLLKKNHYNDIYVDMVMELLEKINLNQFFVFRLDRSLPKRDRKKLTALILKNPKIKVDKLKIFHDESSKYLGLKFADLIAGSCFQYFERGNSKFIDIFKDNHSIYFYNKSNILK